MGTRAREPTPPLALMPPHFHFAHGNLSGPPTPPRSPSRVCRDHRRPSWLSPNRLCLQGRRQHNPALAASHRHRSFYTASRVQMVDKGDSLRGVGNGRQGGHVGRCRRCCWRAWSCLAADQVMGGNDISREAIIRGVDPRWLLGAIICGHSQAVTQDLSPSFPYFLLPI